jgi:hypothetical protein
MKNRKLIFSLVGFLVLAYYSWLIFGSGDWFFPHSKNASNRAAMIKIRDEIHLGDGYENVLRSYWLYAPKDLRLDTGSPKTWTVSMPHEFSAGDWVLWVEFADGKVSAVRVRTSDGPAPSDAPADVKG